MTDFIQQAMARGHTERADFEGGCYLLDLMFSPDAELDGEFTATCMDTGEVLQVYGWNFIMLTDEAA